MSKERMRRYWQVCAAVCVLATALASGVNAAPPGGAKSPPPKAAPGGPPPQAYGYPNGFIERHAKRLELSDETVKELRETVEKSRAENERLRKEVEQAQAGLRKLLAVDVPDEKTVMDQADKIAALVGEQRKNQLRTAIKIRGMLTPKQRAELDKIRKEQMAPGHGGLQPQNEKKKPPFGAGAQAQPPAKSPANPEAAE